jgi:hypothetical protein
MISKTPPTKKCLGFVTVHFGHFNFLYHVRISSQTCEDVLPFTEFCLLLSDIDLQNFFPVVFVQDKLTRNKSS